MEKKNPRRFNASHHRIPLNGGRLDGREPKTAVKEGIVFKIVTVVDIQTVPFRWSFIPELYYDNCFVYFSRSRPVVDVSWVYYHSTFCV